MRTWRLRWLAAVWVSVAFPAGATAQSQPFVVHDTKPVITHGPYLVDPSETSVTVEGGVKLRSSIGGASFST